MSQKSPPTQGNAGEKESLNGNNKQVNSTPTPSKKQAQCNDCLHFCDTAKTRRERSLKLGKTFCYCNGKPTAAHSRACNLFAEVTA